VVSAAVVSSTGRNGDYKQGTEQFLLNIIPNTFVGAFSEGNVLQVLYISVLCGFALSWMGQAGKPLNDLIEASSHLLFRIVAVVMWAAPLGAFGATAFTVGKFGTASLLSLGELLLSFYLPDLRARGALADSALVRVQPVQVHPVYMGGAPDRVCDHFVGNRAAAHDRQA
jgi:Na+/H+-dicarboxylate symporter